MYLDKWFRKDLGKIIKKNVTSKKMLQINNK